MGNVIRVNTPARTQVSKLLLIRVGFFFNTNLFGLCVMFKTSQTLTQQAQQEFRAKTGDNLKSANLTVQFIHT